MLHKNSNARLSCCVLRDGFVEPSTLTEARTKNCSPTAINNFLSLLTWSEQFVSWWKNANATRMETSREIVYSTAVSIHQKLNCAIPWMHFSHDIVVVVYWRRNFLLHNALEGVTGKGCTRPQMLFFSGSAFPVIVNVCHSGLSCLHRKS